MGIAEQGEVLIAGTADAGGEALVLTRPISFWGGVDPKSGRIADPRHPEAGDNVAGRVLFLHDVRRFASKARALAEEARRAGVTVILLTDEFCPWADEASDVALVVPGSHGPLWDGAATMTAVMDLLLSNIIVLLGGEVDERVQLLTRLQDVFGDFEADR